MPDHHHSAVAPRNEHLCFTLVGARSLLGHAIRATSAMGWTGRSSPICGPVRGDTDMSKIIYDEKHYELESLRERMDMDLVDQLDPALDDQDFFDSYLQAHQQKFGERFVVD